MDSHSANKSETANIFRPVQHISVPEQLSAIGVKDIYSVNDIIYFEYTGSIMGVIGYGVLYVEDYSKISEWYYVKLIEENWYYYNVE